MSNPVLCVYVLPCEVKYYERAKVFADSYRKHKSGVDHDLVVVLKGWPSDSYIGINDTIFEDLHPLYYGEENVGYDIASYINVSKIFKDYKYIMCLGNYIEILVDNWLKLFYNIAEEHQKDLGILGAFGSCEKGVKGVLDCNPHIRTIGFMFKPKVLNSYSFGPIVTKDDCYEFEHGKDSFTAKCDSSGLSNLVVGRDGKGYVYSDWPYCNGFRSGNQENLIFHDRHSEHFLTYDEKDKVKLYKSTYNLD